MSSAFGEHLDVVDDGTQVVQQGSAGATPVLVKVGYGLGVSGSFDEALQEAKRGAEDHRAMAPPA